MWKLIGVEKLTNEKFLNFYKVTYLSPAGKEVSWSMASRNDLQNLSCKTGKISANCVCIIPRVMVDGEPALIITKEFRLPIGDYVYGFPAGIIDGGESPIDAAIRELHEEIGATKVDGVKILCGACLNSEGLTDESTITIEAEVLELKEADLQDDEDIDYEIVKLSDMEEYMKGKTFGVRSGLYIPMMVREYELMKKIKQVKEENEELRKQASSPTDTDKCLAFKIFFND